MKLGKIFICINILVLSLLMYGEIYQNTSYRFDEYNRTIVYCGNRGLQNDIGEKYIETYAVAI